MAWISSAFLPATPGLPVKLSAMLGMGCAPRKLSGKLLVKAIGVDPASDAAMRRHEAGAIIARAADRLAQFDRVLGLEMRAAEMSSVPAKGTKAICFCCHSG